MRQQIKQTSLTCTQNNPTKNKANKH